ncbi:MAG: hypothetical protein AAFQ37_06550 [Bacteroidota bacterium]
MRLLLVASLLLVFSCNAGTQKATQTPARVEPTAGKIEGEGITGTWEISSSTPRGNRKSKLTIVQNGETATATSDRGDFTITIKGDQVSWEQEISTPMGNIKTNSVGTIKDANNMLGTMTMSDGPMAGRELSWTAKRIQ